MLHLGGKPQH